MLTKVASEDVKVVPLFIGFNMVVLAGVIWSTHNYKGCQNKVIIISPQEEIKRIIPKLSIFIGYMSPVR